MESYSKIVWNYVVESRGRLRNWHAHHSAHRNHVTKYTSQVRMLRLFDSCDTFLQVLQLGEKGLLRLPGIPTPFFQVLSCSLYFLHWKYRVFGPKIEHGRIVWSQISCMRETKNTSLKRFPFLLEFTSPGRMNSASDNMWTNVQNMSKNKNPKFCFSYMNGLKHW